MIVRFEDPALRRLFEDAGFRIARLPPEIVRPYRKWVNFIIAAQSERDLYSYRAARFEKLKGDRRNQNSVRLNDQWRLILRLESDADGKIAVIVEVVDYH